MEEVDNKGRGRIAAPIMLIICMLTVLLKGGNSDGARLIICYAAAGLLAFSIFLDKQEYSLLEWAPGLTLFGISAVHLFMHKLIWEEVLLWGALALSYWIIILCVSRFSMRQMRIVLVALLLLVTFELLYGVLNRVTADVVSIGLWEKVYYSDSATGTFVNRNHYAGYLALTWPITLATIALLTRRNRALRISLTAVFSILFVFGLLLSKSRMGALAGIIGIFVYAYWQARGNLGFSRRAAIIALVFMLILMAITALWLGVGDIGKRYLVLGESLLIRSTLWKSLFQFPFDIWFNGIGVNQFEQRYMIVQPVQLRYRYVYAHNDYLQFLLEIGIFGFILVAAVFGAYFKKYRFARLDTKRRAAWCGIIAVLIQEMADFDLHMPGLAVVFMMLFGLTLNRQAYSIRRSHKKNQSDYEEISPLIIDERATRVGV